MEIMEISEANDDCSVTLTVPPKQKKLKQALLPFRTLSTPESTSLKNKKRKLSSSSPGSCKNEKMSKIARKENFLDKLNKTEDPDESNDSEKDNNESGDKDKKDEEKSGMKPNALLKYMQMTSGNAVVKQKMDADLPVVVLNRCDAILKERESKENSNDCVKSIDDQESDVNKSNADDEISMDPDRDDAKAGSDGSNENIYISDTETESSPSEDDDDDNDDKRSDDVDDASGKENGNEDKKVDDIEGVSKEDDNSGPKTPTIDKNSEKKIHKQRRLTPKQLEKKIESEKKRAELQKQKDERAKQRIEERIARRAKKEERRVKREAEMEQKRKEKEQKELKKQMEIEQRQKEKERKEKAREEDRRKKEEAKEEEKRKKEEERLEAERKKQRAASTFKSFFVPKSQETKPAIEEKSAEACNFMPFEIKADMKMAPTCRRILKDQEKISFDVVYANNGQNDTKLYLEQIKRDRSKIRRSGKTWPVEAKDDVTIIEDDDIGSANVVDQTSSILEKQRPKLLAFSENRRPPYWGTWRKKSNLINSRRPFFKDTKYFDYENESDDEWEEEEPGESLHGSEDEKDEKDEDNPDENEYDVDNEFMVPHGYLSDEEARADEEDEENMSPESQKFKLKILGEQFEAEMNEKTAKIKPKVIGCIWQGPRNSYPDNTPISIINFLTLRQVWARETPIIIEALIDTDSMNSNDTTTSKKDKEKLTPGPKKTRVPEVALPDLIRLIHGNPNSRSFLVKEFITYWHRKHPDDEQLSQISIGKKIRELARRMLCPEEGPMHLKTCFYVSEEIRKKYVEEELTLPNKWCYRLTPKRKSQVSDVTEPAEKIEKEVDREKEKDQKDKEKEKKSTPLITLFTKKITQEEMKKQLSVKPTPSTAKASITPNKLGKRVALISVARGEQFPKSSIVSAFSKLTQSKTDESLPGSADLPITIEESPVKNDSASQRDHNDLKLKPTCNLGGDKDSVKENRSTELNNKTDHMEVEQTE